MSKSILSKVSSASSNFSIGSTARDLKGGPLKVCYTSTLALSEDEKTLAHLASQILEDPVASRRLSERIVEIIELDLQKQRERGF